MISDIIGVDSLSSVLRLNLFGKFKLTDTRQRSDIDFRQRKTRGVLGLVALSPGASVGRERLAAMLWDSPEEQAKASLRQCLVELRQTIEPIAPGAVFADRFAVGLRTDLITVDAIEFLSTINKAREDEASALVLAELWKGELFGDGLPNAPVFEAWLQIERARFRQELSTLLTQHLQRRYDTQDFTSPRLAQELIRIEPSHEFAHQFMMIHLARSGDPHGAIKQYETLQKALDEELDTTPTQQTLDILVAIKRGDFDGTRSSKVVATPKAAERPQGPPTVVLRPVRIAGTVADPVELTAEGLTGLLSDSLSRFRSWVVLAWPSRGFDQSDDVDTLALHQQTGADYLLDLVLSWQGQTGSIRVSLIDCENRNVIWAEVLTVVQNTLQSVSLSIVGRIASTLASQINQLVLRRLARTQALNPAAYDLWLRAHQLTRRWDADSDKKAMELLERAIEIDPGMACAYASMASILNTTGILYPGYTRIKQDIQKGFELSQQSISLDPFDSRNHINMAWSLMLLHLAERAQFHFNLAVDLNPNDSETLIASSQGAAFLGQHELALRWAERAIGLNPLHPPYYSCYLAVVHYLGGRFPQAVATAKLARAAFPDVLAWQAAASFQAGLSQEAAQHAREFLEDCRDRWVGTAGPTDDLILAWLFDAIPLLDEKCKLLLIEGLTGAIACIGKQTRPATGSGA